MGLAYINFLSYYLKLRNKHPHQPEFKVFENIKRIEWDTLLFFYGVLMSVGGLAALGFLDLLSHSLYVGLGQIQANISMGILSAIVDNTPLMYAVLTMEPAMSQGQWLLITLTCGIGGGLLSISSAAGVALMGQAKGQFTFIRHLKVICAIEKILLSLKFSWNYQIPS